MRLFSFGAGRTGARGGMPDGQDEHPRSAHMLGGRVVGGRMRNQEFAAADHSPPSGGYTIDTTERPTVPPMRATGGGPGRGKLTESDKRLNQINKSKQRQYDVQTEVERPERQAAMAKSDAREAKEARHKQGMAEQGQANQRMQDKVAAGQTESKQRVKRNQYTDLVE